MESSKQQTKGLGLVELMIGLFISALLISAIYGVFNKQNKRLAAEKLATDIQQHSQSLLARLKFDLRRAGSNPVDFFSYDAAVPMALAVAEPQRLRLLIDGNGDNDTLDLNEDITYQYIDSDSDGQKDQLQRIDAASGNILKADNVTFFQLDYLTAGGREVGWPDPPSLVRQVKIKLTISSLNIDSQTGQRITKELEGVVSLRNLQ